MATYDNPNMPLKFKAEMYKLKLIQTWIFGADTHIRV